MDLKLELLLIISAQIATTLAARGPIVACPAIYSPVCGSDGKTYSNACMLQGYVQNTGKEVTVIKTGPCEQAPQPCFCTDDLRPVCGTDGVTYANECALECEKARSNPTLRVMDYSGPCKPPQAPACGCSLEYDPVCGSDGNTYENSCVLKCIAQDNFLLKFAYTGAC